MSHDGPCCQIDPGPIDDKVVSDLGARQGSRKLVSVVSRIPDKSFLVRQFMFKTTIKTGPKAQPAKTKLHRHQLKMQNIKTESNIIRHINIHKVRQTKTVSQ